MSDFGPQIIATGEGEIRVDIVFVHGWQGHRLTTWSTTGGEGVCWPKDVLPKSFPEARIITYGYDGNLASPFKSSSINNIGDHAKNLVNDLISERNAPEERKRPIIFVAHSLGGIIVKDAINTIELGHNRFPERKSLQDATKSIIFLGTPHRGAKGVDVAQFIGRIVTLDSKDGSSVLEELKHNAPTLERISEDFESVLAKFDEAKKINFTIFSFTEELPEPGIGFIVDKASAVLDKSCERRQTIPATHRNLCKFKDKDDAGYKRILFAITTCDQNMQAELQRTSVTQPLEDKLSQGDDSMVTAQ